jgi:topoisomerase-4 subunit A
LGEFAGEDKLIVFFNGGQYYTTGFDLGQHFPEDTMFVKKYEADKVYAVTYYDAEQKYFYVKRFQAEATDRPQLFVDESPGSYMVGITGAKGVKLTVTYGGEQSNRPPETIDLEEFIGVKSHRAKGKRITTWPVDKLEFLKPAPAPVPEPEELPDEELPDEEFEGADVEEDGEDGQMALF